MLRLLESVGLDELTATLEDALPRGGITAEALRLLVQARRESVSGGAEPLSLEGRPRLQAVRVGKPDLAAYRGLLPAGEVRL